MIRTRIALVSSTRQVEVATSKFQSKASVDGGFSHMTYLYMLITRTGSGQVSSVGDLSQVHAMFCGS